MDHEQTALGAPCSITPKPYHNNPNHFMAQPGQQPRKYSTQLWRSL